MFNQEGNFNCRITEVYPANSQFAGDDPNAYDIVARVEAHPGQGVDGQSDLWRGEMSARMCGGNKSHLTKAQATLEELAKLGVTDPCQLAILSGKDTVVWVTADVSKKNGNTYHNVRSIASSSSSAPERIDPAEAARRLAAMMAPPVGFQQTGATPAPVMPAAQAQFGQTTQQFPAQPAPTQQFPAQPAFPAAQPAAAPVSPFGPPTQG